jgi:hypothetical protein
MGLSTILFAGAAVAGYKMFGEATESQFTLNLPENLVVSKVAVWTTVILAAISQLLILQLHFCVGQDQILSMKSNQLYFMLPCR